MTYLLAQFTFLFLLTAAAAFMLGRWWSRRNCVEVTESYQSLLQSQREREAASWDKLFDVLESLKEVTVTQVRAIPQPVIPEYDLSGLDEQIAALSEQVTALPQPEKVDLSTIQTELKNVRDAVANIRIPEAPKLDLATLENEISGLSGLVRAIPTSQAKLDLTPALSRIADLEKRVVSIRLPEPPPQVDLQPLERQLTQLDSSIRSIPRPQAPQTVSLDDTNARLSAIEKALRKIKPAEPAPVPKPAPAPAPKMGSANRLLKAPPVKDDLKQISGVGPMLERLLNNNGIYCFWQIARWTPGNIQEMEERLDGFKGRISRDKWTTQARRLQRDSPAKAPPA